MIKDTNQIEKEVEEIVKKREERVALARARKYPEMSLEELDEILSLTIKEDKENKLIAFLGLLSAFTPEEQLNISFSAPSSSGKTYIATEIAKLFPKDYVKELGYCSPKSFFHEYGEYNKETREYTIDFSNQIIVFLDMPHSLLLEHMRPLLSKDKKVVQHKITDKHNQLTKTINWNGFFSTIFCSANPRLDEQESTRFIVLSPETTQDKMAQAVVEKAKKSVRPKEYNKNVKADEKRKELIQRVEDISCLGIKEIRLNITENEIVEAFKQDRPVWKPRHSRDLEKVISLCKSISLLNYWDRRTEEPTAIISTREDFDKALTLWNNVAEPQELNISPYCYQVYKEIFLPLWEIAQQETSLIPNRKKGVKRPDISKKYLKVYGRSLSDEKLRKDLIPSWENAGLVSKQSDPDDARSYMLMKT